MGQYRDDKIRLKNFIDCSELGTWEWNVQTGETVFNETWAQIVGYTLEELAPVSIKTWGDLAHPDDLKASGKMLERHFTGELPYYDIECRMRHKNGHWIWVHDRGKVVSWTADGQPLMMFGTHTDITGRKRSEDELKKSESMFRTLINSIKDSILVMGIEADGDTSKFMLVNDAACTNLGYSREELLQLSPNEIDVIGRSGQVPSFGEKLLRDKHVLFESEHIAKDGHSFPVEVSLNLFQLDGMPANIAIARDITERKRAEMAIAEEKELLSVTLRSIGDGVITTNVDGTVVLMNKVAETLTGWKQAEAQGKPLGMIFNIVNENTRKPHENPVEKVIASGHIVELENHTILISRDGTERVIADSGAPIRDQNSKNIGVVLVFRDMTEKNKLQSNIHRMDRLDSVGILAGGIAHDFNNLLGGIFGYIDLARIKCSEDKVISGYLDKTLMVLDRAKNLTDQLLTFSKGGAPKFKTGEIGELVRDNAAFVLSGLNVNCDFNIAAGLHLCDFDEHQIGQVIDNVVLNAQQAMPMGGTILITVENILLKSGIHSRLKGGDYVRISIKDKGIGIPHDIMKHIFDPFFTTKQKGNGLGLATCYSIMQKHDGTIEVESVLGEGSTFHIYLPASHKETPDSLSGSTAQHLGSGTVIVMDDEDFMRDIVSTMLADMGYSPIEAQNGAEALQLCEKELGEGRAVRAAFFDLTVPGGMGGKETIIQFRERFTDIPVFASSGYSEDPAMAKPTDFGFTDSIRKPYKKKDLAEMLNKHFSAGS